MSPHVRYDAVSQNVADEDNQCFPWGCPAWDHLYLETKDGDSYCVKKVSTAQENQTMLTDGTFAAACPEGKYTFTYHNSAACYSSCPDGLLTNVTGDFICSVPTKVSDCLDTEHAHQLYLVHYETYDYYNYQRCEDRFPKGGYL